MRSACQSARKSRSARLTSSGWVQAVLCRPLWTVTKVRSLIRWLAASRPEGACGVGRGRRRPRRCRRWRRCHPEPGRPLRNTGLLLADPPSPLDPPSGCRFRARCPLTDDRCATQPPATREVAPGWTVACHRPHPVPVGPH
ncbi:oligopeptide/dipeptide ABC transporter ATP-binding protein [Streptomyces sp. NPDC051286]|uniref:oligopeptide/dipeptide ABC transporter ATP-binding protein n=1 Tax=Streptomyces sp. NPDC051286 TaxID=3365647 RepID=UPI00379CDD80